MLGHMRHIMEEQKMPPEIFQYIRTWISQKATKLSSSCGGKHVFVTAEQSVSTSTTTEDCCDVEELKDTIPDQK